jgi:O-antigen/teichoic acid export membrane protein
MLVDGLYHVLAMVRINFNPLLVRALRDRDHDEAVRLQAISRKYLLPITAILAVAICIGHYDLTVYLLPGKELEQGIWSLAILLVGLVSVSFLVPFDNLMLVSGHPGQQTVQQVATVAANILAALVFIPVLGIEGAAIGTSLAYITGALLLLVFGRRVVGWALLRNTFR